MSELEKMLGEVQAFDGPQVMDDSGLPKKALQRVQTDYVTAVAVQEPRSLAKVVRGVLEEARLAGSEFYYGWPVRNKDGTTGRVEGESIDLAMCIFRHYGNAVIDIDVEEGPTHYIFKSVFIDLEKGLTLPRLFRQRKGQKLSSKMDDDRQEDVVFQIGQSKAQRNAVSKAMPRWLIKEAIATAKQAAISKIEGENIELAKAKALEFFKSYEIDDKDLAKLVGKKIGKWTAEDIANLRGTANAINEGRITPEKLMEEAGDAEKSKKKAKKPESSEKKEPGGESSSPIEPTSMEILAGFAGEEPDLYKDVLDKLQITHVMTESAAVKVLEYLIEQKLIN